MVWPDMLVTTSPGLVALPPGMFSLAAMTPTTLIGSFISAMACRVPSTEAAPHMSNFISSISAAGLSEMPPVSKVMPLPISATGACLAGPPAYCRTISLGGSSEPRATDSREPILSASICLRSSTCTLSLNWVASLRAASARYDGVQMLPGRLPRSRARSWPLARALARASASWAGVDSARSTSSWTRPGRTGWVSLRDLSRSNR